MAAEAAPLYITLFKVGRGEQGSGGIAARILSAGTSCCYAHACFALTWETWARTTTRGQHKALPVMIHAAANMLIAGRDPPRSAEVARGSAANGPQPRQLQRPGRKPHLDPGGGGENDGTHHTVLTQAGL